MMNSMLQHQMFEKFNCEKCRFSTKDPNKYRNHVSLHNDIKYACSHCDFASYTKTEFQRHLVTHTGKFPFICGYCGYGAIRNDYIIKHIRRIHGDGKILCSVSTVENESMKASINITQTQLTAPDDQNNLQKSPSSEDIIDLTTEMDNFGSSSKIFLPNGNSIAGDVEVEVISPVDQQLYPWIPLTVVAPTSFRVPPNCIAQVVEVKPVNSACHLVLKCLNVVKSSVPNESVSSEHIYEQKPSKSDLLPKNIIKNSDGPSLQESAVLYNDCKENISYPSYTVCRPEEDLHTNLTCATDTNEIVNAIKDANNMFDDLEDFSGGPIISSVFSLSSDSQNSIEGIHWDCPFSRPSTIQSNDVDAPHSNLIPSASLEGPIACGSELNVQMDINKPPDVLKNSVMEREKEPTDNNIEREKEPSEKNTEREKEPPENNMESDKEPSENLESEKEPSENMESEKEPSENMESEKEPSENMESEKEPSENMESEKEPSETIMESEKEPSENMERENEPYENMEHEKESSENNMECEKKTSENYMESEKEPSETIMESEKEPSETIMESEKEPSENNMESEKEPSESNMESEKEPSENNMEKVKESSDPEIQFFTTLVPTDVKKSQSQPCVLEKSRKGGRISDRLGKIETNFSKPQTLFLSYDKRIVLQPLSCTMQGNGEMSSQVDKVTELQLQFQVKTRKESAKAKVKRLASPIMKGRCQPNLRTLRLFPFKVDQVAHTPCYNQPVVVLNHPDVESIETSHIMKAIRVFGGKMIKITLSKQMCKYV